MQGVGGAPAVGGIGGGAPYNKNGLKKNCARGRGGRRRGGWYRGPPYKKNEGPIYLLFFYSYPEGPKGPPGGHRS